MVKLHLIKNDVIFVYGKTLSDFLEYESPTENRKRRYFLLEMNILGLRKVCLQGMWPVKKELWAEVTVSGKD